MWAGGRDLCESLQKWRDWEEFKRIWLSLVHTVEEACATGYLTAYSCFSWQKQPSNSKHRTVKSFYRDYFSLFMSRV